MVLAVSIGLPASASNAASLSSLSRGVAPEAAPPRVTPPLPRLGPMPRGTMAPQPSMDVPLPPRVEAPATTAPPTVVAEPEVPPAAPLAYPLVVKRPPEPLVILDPPPPPGTGMRVGGGILIGLGGLDTLVGGTVMALGNEDGRPLGIAQLALGIVELGSGITLVAYGTRRARRLAAWKAQSNYAVPKTGNGMLVGGSVLLGVGFYDGLGAAAYVHQTGQVPVGNVAIAATEVVAGALLLVVGSARKRRYQRWVRESFAFTGPSVTSLPGGMAMGMRGRF